MFTNTVFTKQRDVMYTINSVIVSKIARGDATNGEIWREGVECGPWSDTLHRLILSKSLKGIRPLGANFYQKLEIFASLIYLKSPHYYTYIIPQLRFVKQIITLL